MLLLLLYTGQEEELSLSAKSGIIINDIEYCVPVIIFKHFDIIISFNPVILK